MAQALWRLRAELGRGPFGDHTSYAMASDLRVCDLARRLGTKTLLSWVRSSVLRSREVIGVRAGRVFRHATGCRRGCRWDRC
jgi:hypothetical protein